MLLIFLHKSWIMLLELFWGLTLYWVISPFWIIQGTCIQTWVWWNMSVICYVIKTIKINHWITSLTSAHTVLTSKHHVLLLLNSLPSSIRFDFDIHNSLSVLAPLCSFFQWYDFYLLFNFHFSPQVLVILISSSSDRLTFFYIPSYLHMVYNVPDSLP